MNRRPIAIAWSALVLPICLGLAVASCASVPPPTIEASISPSARASTTPSEAAPAATANSPTPGPTEITSSAPLPSPGGTCSAGQLAPGTATNAYTYSAIGWRHVHLDQPLRNDGHACVLKVPAMIGVAPATGPFEAVRVNNVGHEVCVNNACHYASPASFRIRAGQSLTIGFDVSWWADAGDANGTSLPTAPPCPGALHDVTRVEVPLASGVITIDLEAAVRMPESSVPWHGVCAGRDRISLTITTE